MTQIRSFHPLTDHLSDPWLLLDGKGLLLDCNRACRDLLEIPEKEGLTGTSFSSFLDAAGKEQFRLFLTEMPKSSEPDQIILNIQVNGATLPARVVAAVHPLQDPQGNGISCLIQPVSPAGVDLQRWEPGLESEDLQWLSEQGRLLMWLTQGEEILKFAGRQLEQKIGSCVVLTLSVTHSGELLLEGIHGLDGGLLSRVWNLAGGNLIGKTFKRDERFQDEYDKRRLFEHPAGFADFAASFVPKPISRKIAELVGIERVYTIGLEGNQRTMGNFHIFTLDPDLQIRPELVESFSYQTALALEKAQFAGDLQDTEQRFRMLFEYAPDAYYISDLKGTFIDGNEAAEEITGYSSEELIGKNFLEIGLLPKYQLPRVMKALGRNIAGKSTGPEEYILLRKDGREVEVEISTHPVSINEKTLVLGIARDISLRKQTEEKLVQAQETITRVLESIDAHIYVADLKTHTILYMNQRMIEDFGGDFTGQTCYEVFREECSPCDHCTNEDLLDGKGEPGEVVAWEGHNHLLDRWFRNYDRAIYWSDQRLVRLEIAVDITESKQAALALELNEERYRRLFESAKDAMMTLVPPDWHYASANPALMELFRLENEEQFIGLKPWELSPERQPDGGDSQQLAEERIQIALDQGSHFFEWQHRRIDGKLFPATVLLTRVDTEQETFLQATVRDITNRVEAERIMQQQMEDLALINKLNVAANEGKSLQEIVVLLQQEAKRVFKCSNLLVYFLSDDRQTLTIDLTTYDRSVLEKVKSHLGFSIPGEVEIPVRQDGLFWQLIHQDKPQSISEPDKIAEMVYEPFRMELLSSADQAGAEEKLSSAQHWLDIGSVLTIPLKLKGRTIGLISLTGAETFPEQVGWRFRAIAEQVSGIIERTRAEQERQRNLQELQLINETFVEGTRLDDIDQISQLLADKIHQANPGSYVMISLYDPEYEAIRVRAITGVGKMIARVADLLGKHPTDLLIKINQHQLDPDLEELFTSGRIQELPEGLYSLTRGVIPRAICRTVERVLGIDRTYIAGLSLGEKSSGGITVFVKEGQEIRHPAAIETISNHFAAVFERRQIMEEIEQRTTQLEALRAVGMDIVRELNLDDLLISIAEKAASMINANDSGFSIYNPDVDALEFQAFTGKEEVLPENTTLMKTEGLAGKVWEKEKTIIVDHYASWEGRSEEWAQAYGDYSVIGVPVRWGHEFLGVLELALEPGRQFTQREIDSLELFANQAAIAIQNARLFTGEHHRRQEAETLREVGMIINSMMDRSQVLNSILEQLHRVLPFDSASIQLMDGASVVVEAVAGCLDPKAVLGRRFPVSEDRLVNIILDQGQAEVVDDVRESEDWIEFGDTLYVRSWIGVPLQFRGENIGLMTVDHHQVGQYSRGDAQLAMNFANQAAIAIENARLLEKAQKQQREAETLRDVGMLISKTMDRSSVINMILDQLQYVLEYSNASIQLLDNDHLVIEAVRGADSPEELLGSSVPVDEKSVIRSMLMDVEAAVIDDLQQLEKWSSYPGSENIHAWLGVPLEIQNKCIGILTVEHQQIARYDEHDAELVSAFAAQAAIALENSRLFEEAQRRMYRIESLREIDQAISGSLDLQTTLEVLIGQLINTLEVDAAAVLLYKPGLQTLDYVSGRGFRTDFLQYTSLQIGEGLAGRAALQRKMIHVPDLSAQETSLQNSPRLEQESFVTYLAEPLIAKGEIVGVLEVFHRSLLKPDHEWIDFLDALASQAAIAIDRLNLYNDLERSNVELIQAYDATIEGWAKAVELRDGETEGHSRRVVQMTLQLARRLGITGESLADIRRGTLLHDIGKMAVPDSILLKPGDLSEEDWKVMKQHPALAYEMLSGIEYLRRALDIPYCHHERWDGSGYPRGVSGEEIPLSARIFAVVDVWDALLSDRPYRGAWSEEEVLAYIKDQSGKHFDPDVVKEFFQLIESK